MTDPNLVTVWNGGPLLPMRPEMCSPMFEQREISALALLKRKQKAERAAKASRSNLTAKSLGNPPMPLLKAIERLVLQRGYSVNKACACVGWHLKGAA